MLPLKFWLESLSLNPFDKISTLLKVPEDSALVLSGDKVFTDTLEGDLEVSCINQLSVVPEDTFTSRNLGRIPVNTNGPSVLPLPV